MTAVYHGLLMRVPDRAYGVSADGFTFVGYGENSSAPTELQAWRADLTPTGDTNGDGTTDGLDVQRFVEALLANSTVPSDLRRADFNRDGAVDIGDAPGMVTRLLTCSGF